MKIRTALTLKHTFVTAAVFLLCLVMVYFVSEHSRSRTFFHELKSEAATKAQLFLQNRVDAGTMHAIYLNNRQFVNEIELAVYTTDFHLLYRDAAGNDTIGSRRLLENILLKKEMEFYQGKTQCVGILYTFEGKSYIVTASACDNYGYTTLHELRDTLVYLFCFGLLLLYITCYLLARASLKPIRDIVKEVETISASQIDKRLPRKNGKDEIGELCTAFNDLLDRLEKSFTSQKMFISNVSHELRTPLAALIAQLDLTLQKERTEAQYRQAIGNGLQDGRRMKKLIDGLLNLAKADYGKERIKMQEIRLDELLLDARQFLLRAHPDYHIELLFEEEEADDDRLITVMGNVYLLNIAFSNLIENNCKYSHDKSSFVQISYWDRSSIIRLSDDGIGLSETDKQHLFTLFYRGEQENMVEGHGIGMALAQKIILLHQGQIAVHSEQGKGTTFVIELPHI